MDDFIIINTFINKNSEDFEKIFNLKISKIINILENTKISVKDNYLDN